jgi:hypothetical protein
VQIRLYRRQLRLCGHLVLDTQLHHLRRQPLRQLLPRLLSLQRKYRLPAHLHRYQLPGLHRSGHLRHLHHCLHPCQRHLHHQLRTNISSQLQVLPKLRHLHRVRFRVQHFERRQRLPSDLPSDQMQSMRFGRHHHLPLVRHRVRFVL